MTPDQIAEAAHRRREERVRGRLDAIRRERVLSIAMMAVVLAFGVFLLGPARDCHRRELAEASAKDVTSLAISESTRVGRWYVTRVPCGWIYNRSTDPPVLVHDSRCNAPGASR